MIDPSIYKVYKQEKKVIIPDFGAIIYSEATDSVDFNEFLSFDDGKVIAEIQSRQKKTKKVAEEALKEHIDKIKAKMDEGKPHLIRGLGYIYKVEEGSYAIQKKKPVVPVIKEKLAEEEQAEEEMTASQHNESEETEINATVMADTESDSFQTDEYIAEDFEPDFIVGNEKEDEDDVDSEEKEEILLENEELPYSHKPLLSQEDEDVQQYYKRLDEYEHGGKNRKPLYYILAAIILVLMLASAAVYYFNFYSEDKTSDFERTNVSSANISNSEDDQADPTSKNEIAQEVNAKSSSDTQVQSNSTEQRNEIASSSNSDEAVQYDKIYSLILGSFKVESNADNFQEYLVGQGKDVSIFRRGVSSFHFVGYEQISGKSNAVSLLDEAREEEPTAWIIRNKQF